MTRPVTHRLVPLRVIDGPRVLLTRNSHRWLQLRSLPLRACWQRDPGWRAAEGKGRLRRAPTQDLPPEGGPGSKTAIPLCERGTRSTCARPRRTRAGTRATRVRSLRTRRGRRRQGGRAGAGAQRAITRHPTFVLSERAPLLKRMSEQEKSSKHKRAPLFLRTYKDSYTHSLSTGTRTERIETHALHGELEDEGPHRPMPCGDCREPTPSYHSMDHLRASRGPRAAWSRAATW